MFCTNCGFQFQGNFCPECGAPAVNPQAEPPAEDPSLSAGPLPVQVPSEDLPSPPLGQHKGNLCSVTLFQDHLLLHKKPFAKATDTEIYYADLASVSFNKGSGFSSGFVCLRTRQSHTPPATSFTAPSDPFSACFLPAQREEFFQIYEFLNAVAVKNNFPPPQELPQTAASPVPPSAPPPPLSGAGMAKICPNCGEMLLAQAKTCPTCGCKQLLSVDKSDTEKIRQIRSHLSHPEAALTPNWKAYTPPPPSKKQLAKQRIAENKANAVACCPKCGSTSLSANKKGFGVGKAIFGASIIGKYGLTAGNLHSQKVIVTCLNCGHQWKP